MTAVHLSGGGGGQQCSLPAPVPSLTAQLRAIGGFDQPYDASDRTAISTVAMQAASTVSPSLVGGVAAPPVAVASLLTSQPDALVIPLISASATRSAHIVGLVSFLRDCAGRAYYSAVQSTIQTAPTSFPSVDIGTAASRLGTASPQLVYRSNPFAPLWRNPMTGATISAGG